MPDQAMQLTKTIYIGTYAHCTPDRKLSISPDSAIGIDEQGTISYIDHDVPDISHYISTISDGSHRPSWQHSSIIHLSNQEFFFPGFIDTHIHASQFPNMHLVSQSTLLDWLETYTFPTEKRFSDLQYAKQIYSDCVDTLVRNGTTTAAYFATIHVPATNLLAEICHTKGQRAFIGRVCMERTCPDDYRDKSTESCITDTRATIEYINKLDPKNELVQGIITPRFAPSCTEKTLASLGNLARETNSPIQTHISENKDEIKLVGELFPDADSYADVYDRAGLLTSKTILAHAVHLSDKEMQLVKSRQAKIAHCPLSNTCLSSGIAPVREMLDQGIEVGLGTDVSGGYSPRMLDAVRHCILVSRHASMSRGPRVRLSTEEALCLATRGGAKVLGLQDKIGAFEVGMHWDAQRIRVAADTMVMTQERADRMSHNSAWSDKIDRWVYGGDVRNCVSVWVKGRLVCQSSQDST